MITESISGDSPDLPIPRELHFVVNGMAFAAQEWGVPGQLPVLALHGWLDNCASFFALAPRLNHLHIVALDMAGHGQSEHRSGASSYAFWDDISDIFAVADYFGWDKFVLMGHSRGAILSMLAAGTFPQRIQCLMLIEGILPEPAPLAEAPQQLANSIQSVRIQAQKPSSIYPTIELAIKAREQGMFPLSYRAAKALTLRGVKQRDDGCYWGTDRRLWAPSAMKLSREQIQAFMQRVNMPVKILVATNGLPKIWAHYADALVPYPDIEVELLEGGHHLHMEAEVEVVAEKVQQYLNPFINSHSG